MTTHMKVKPINVPKIGKAHSITTPPLERSTKMTAKPMGPGSVVKKGLKSISKSR